VREEKNAEFEENKSVRSGIVSVERQTNRAEIYAEPVEAKSNRVENKSNRAENKSNRAENKSNRVENVGLCAIKFHEIAIDFHEHAFLACRHGFAIYPHAFLICFLGVCGAGDGPEAYETNFLWSGDKKISSPCFSARAGGDLAMHVQT
jgi:hypothetical protein